MEFRNPSWFSDNVTAMLHDHDAVYCRADMPDFYQNLPIPDTARYRYYRRHGAPGPTRYSGSYSDDALALDAREMAEFARSGGDVFTYFNNDIHGHAPKNASTIVMARFTGGSAARFRAKSNASDGSIASLALTLICGRGESAICSTSLIVVSKSTPLSIFSSL